jgi:transcriptional regulator with XRE-family HTH domain
MSTAITKSLGDRIRQIADEHGGPSILARAAGLAPSTVTQYLSVREGRRSEPGVAALIKLAKAANVSVNWLATGEGPKNANNPLPEGYFAVPFFDLRASGGRIYAFNQEQVAAFRIFEAAQLGHPAARDLRCFDAFEEVGLEIRCGDLVVADFSVSARATPGHPPWPANFKDGDLYVVAQEAKVMLRYLHRQRGAVKNTRPAIVATAPNQKDMVIAADALDFVVIGRVIWRGGRLP